jgi:hypothetical protein
MTTCWLRAICLRALIHAVEDLRLVVHGRLRGVEVLGSFVVGHDPARAESDHLAGQIL